MKPTLPKSAIWAILGGILIVAAVLGVAWRFGVDEQILRLLHWLDAQGVWAPVLFVVIMAAATAKRHPPPPTRSPTPTEN